MRPKFDHALFFEMSLDNLNFVKQISAKGASNVVSEWLSRDNGQSKLVAENREPCLTSLCALAIFSILPGTSIMGAPRPVTDILR